MDNDFDLDLGITGQDAGTPTYYSKVYRNNLTYYVTGTISGASPLEGTTVQLSGDATASTSTKDSGAYSFSALGNGDFTVIPSRTNYVFDTQSRLVNISGANKNDINFTAYPDADGDGIKDSIDNCTNVPNVEQPNTDHDSLGDDCDPDDDGDAVADVSDCAPLDNSKWRLDTVYNKMPMRMGLEKIRLLFPELALEVRALRRAIQPAPMGRTIVRPWPMLIS
ncbi:MAG: thrombospondin type 3 repeat-containing protein [Deltaproteobacteria bacterium]|nr:thrombospondin type 3 repeat-containing protein [Deltaproteobacteria bacterium]